ncbi:hypothetical protein AB0M72_20920 [Nocardiopsis dassonvillei]
MNAVSARVGVHGAGRERSLFPRSPFLSVARGVLVLGQAGWNIPASRVL